MGINRESKFGEAESFTANAVRQIRGGVVDLRREADTEASIADRQGNQNPTAPLHKAIGEAYQKAAQRIESILSDLVLEVEDVMTPSKKSH